MRLLDEFRASLAHEVDRVWPLNLTIESSRDAARVSDVLDRIRAVVTDVDPQATVVAHDRDAFDPAAGNAALVARIPVPDRSTIRLGGWSDQIGYALCDTGLATNEASTDAVAPDADVTDGMVYEVVMLLENCTATADQIRDIFAVHAPSVDDATWTGFVELPDGNRSEFTVRAAS